MNIRKIIKEEVDNFDWTKEIPIPRIHQGVKVVVGPSVPSAEGTVLTVQNIFNKGEDGSGEKMVTMSWDDGNSSYDYTYDSVMRFTDRGGIWKILKEEIDDFEWASHSPDDIVKELYNKTIIDLNNYIVKLPFVRDKIDLSRWDRDPIKRVKSIIELRKNILKYHIEMVYGIESDEVINYITKEYFKLFF